jgi:hypothetical protein
MNESKDIEAQSKSEKAWKYYQHADSVIAGRTNFYLVAQSMLIVSFVSTTSKIIRLAITILAFVYTLAWQYVNARLSRRRDTLNKYLKKR